LVPSGLRAVRELRHYSARKTKQTKCDKKNSRHDCDIRLASWRAICLSGKVLGMRGTWAVPLAISSVVLGLVAASSKKSTAKRTRIVPPPTSSAEKSRAIIEKLDTSIQPLAWALLADAWEKLGTELVLTSGYRSLEEQEILYQKGRTTPGPIVTNARPGQSWHNYGLAFDVAPVGADGKIYWPNDAQSWRDLAELGKARGLGWGGDFKSIFDPPHFEYHPGVTLEEAAAGKRPEPPEGSRV
jgi:hypothetical protein